MPAPELNARHQNCVLWEATGKDEHGETEWGNPQELVVRWIEDENNVFDAEGNTVACDVTVVLNREVPVDSLFWLGTFTELDEADSPLTEVRQLVRRRNVADIKGRVHRRRGFLKRFKDIALDDLRFALTDENGDFVLDENGKKMLVEGTFAT